MDKSVHLQLSPKPPEPADGCDVCAALVEQRREAKARGNYSAATDANVEIRNHPHWTEGRRR